MTLEMWDLLKFYLWYFGLENVKMIEIHKYAQEQVIKTWQGLINHFRDAYNADV